MANEINYIAGPTFTGHIVEASVVAVDDTETAVPLVEGPVGIYRGDMPALPAGQYLVRFTSVGMYFAAGEILWDGAKEVNDLTVGVVTHKVLVNKKITDPNAGTYTIYDDDDTTPLLQGDLFEDAAGTTRYSGDGAERHERLT